MPITSSLACLCPYHHTSARLCPRLAPVHPAPCCTRGGILAARGAFVNRAVTCPRTALASSAAVFSPSRRWLLSRRDFAVDKRRGSSVQCEALRSSHVVTPMHAVRGPEGEP